MSIHYENVKINVKKMKYLIQWSDEQQWKRDNSYTENSRNLSWFQVTINEHTVKIIAQLNG